MAAITVSSLAPVVRTSRVAQTNQIVRSFLFTSQQFFGLGPTSVHRKETLLCLRTNSANQDSSIDLDSEWIDPVRFRVSHTLVFAPSSCDANLVNAVSNVGQRVSRSVTHG